MDIKKEKNHSLNHFRTPVHFLCQHIHQQLKPTNTKKKEMLENIWQGYEVLIWWPKEKYLTNTFNRLNYEIFWEVKLKQTCCYGIRLFCVKSWRLSFLKGRESYICICPNVTLFVPHIWSIPWTYFPHVIMVTVIHQQIEIISKFKLYILF